MTRKYSAAWKGPLTTDGLPQQALVRVCLECRHEIKEDREGEVSRVLAGVMGKARVTHHGLRRYLSWNKSRWRAAARVTRRRVCMRVAKLKASQIQTLVEALMVLDGVRDLRIVGRVKQNRRKSP